MTSYLRISLGLTLVVSACSFPKPSNVSIVGGQVHGLWNGTDGVALRLEADGIDTLLTVPADGDFSFGEQLVQGASYTVTIATNPAKHSCVVDRGGNGTVASADITNVSIACKGPEVVITPSDPWGWTFDPLQETQTFSGSIATQEVAFTFSGDLTGASVDGGAVAINKQSSPVTLPLGTTDVPIVVTANGGLSKTYHLVFDRGAAVLEQAVYGKASFTEQGASLGYSIALSGDTLAVAAVAESNESGTVYVFVRKGTTWTQQARLKASNTAGDDSFGISVSLSGDTLAVGADGEDSSAVGVGNSQGDGSPESGAVYVFARHGETWSQEAYIKASNTGMGDFFGWSVALSGNTLAVGAIHEDSSATGTIAPDQNSEAAVDAGAVYVFVRDGATWRQQAYIKASDTSSRAFFGWSIALAGDTLAVGAYGASSVYIFARTGAVWNQQALETVAGSSLGYSVALSGDTLAVGAVSEAAPDQASNMISQAGGAYVFVRDGTTWSQQAHVHASDPGERFFFGYSVALFGDMLAVGAQSECGHSTGVNGDQTNEAITFFQAGAAYVFLRSGTTWSQQAYVKASNTGREDQFGAAIALSGDTLVVGAVGESSNAMGLDAPGGQSNDMLVSAGAVYIFR